MALTRIAVPGRVAPVGWAPLGLGFRPFFLLAGAAAVALLAAWLLFYTGRMAPPAYYDLFTWHGHEMLFGYTVAVVAGFLLTAVRNWTGVPTPTGVPLAALALLWLAGRLVALLPWALPGWAIATVDLAFLPALAAALARPLLQQPQARQVVFLPLLLALAAANVLVHLQMLGVTVATARPALRFGVDVIVLIIAIIGGRVLPFFTQRGVGAQPRQWPAVEWAVAISTGGVAVADLLTAPPALLGPLAAAAALAHAARLWGWYDHRIWRMPLLWVLHLGYAWLVVGFALLACASAGLVIAPPALHGLTVGAIGGLTLGMMARVALGHTGRPLQAAPAIGLACGLINAAAAVRVLAAAALPDWYPQAVVGAGLLWIAAFGLFTAVYAPILVRARADGQPG
jgi:uncharacterized protein involved in response to NO